MSGQVSSSCSSNLGGFSHRSWSDRESCRCSGNVCASHPEPVNVICDVVDSLDNAVGINILVAAASHTESILCLGFGRVDVLVTKTELTKLILCMELTGGSLDGHWKWSWSKQLGFLE